MSPRLADVASVDLLRSCWHDVLAADREDGALGTGVARFAESADERLEELAGLLTNGEYPVC
jgi:hypothetical protein